jgi:hypothetical protein
MRLQNGSEEVDSEFESLQRIDTVDEPCTRRDPLHTLNSDRTRPIGTADTSRNAKRQDDLSSAPR